MCHLKGVSVSASGFVPVLGKRITPILPCPPTKVVKNDQEENNQNLSNLPLAESPTNTTSTPEVVTNEKASVSLIQAARRGDLSTIKSLIESEEVDVNQQIVGCTALHYAVFYNRKDIVDVLINAGANLDVQNPSGVTPLSWAVEQAHVDIAWTLLEAAADPAIGDKAMNLTPLHKATKLKNYEMVETLLSINTEEEMWTDPNVKTTDGCTPAYFAAFQGSLEILKLLIDFNAKIDLPSDKGVTPLHRAASANRVEVVRLLLENNANTQVEDFCKRTPLLVAATCGHHEIVKLLIDHGAKLTPEKLAIAKQTAERKRFAEVVSMLNELSN